MLDRAKRSETAIYAIGLRAGEIGRREFKEAEFVLKQLATETGGRAYFVNDARELPKIYQSIWDELSSQYAIGYTPTNELKDGGYRKLDIKLANKDLKAQARKGYYAIKPDSR